MEPRELYEALARSCVAFHYLFPSGLASAFCGVYVQPNLIATVLHPFGEMTDRKGITISLPRLRCINLEGKQVPITDYEIMPTGDAVLLSTSEEAPYIPLHPNPASVPKGALVYLWGYPISVEGYTLAKVQQEAYRYPYWGLFSVGFWEGPAGIGLSEVGQDYRVLTPSIKGQSGSPCFIFQDGKPYLLGNVSVTFSTASELSFYEQSISYISGVEHFANSTKFRQAMQGVVTQKRPVWPEWARTVLSPQVLIPAGAFALGVLLATMSK